MQQTGYTIYLLVLLFFFQTVDQMFVVVCLFVCLFSWGLLLLPVVFIPMACKEYVLASSGCWPLIEQLCALVTTCIRHVLHWQLATVGRGLESSKPRVQVATNATCMSLGQTFHELS